MSPERLQEVLEWIRDLATDRVSPVFVRVFPIALASFVVLVAMVFLIGRRK